MILDINTKILKLTRDRGWIIATAESCTGGLISSSLTELPGSSAIFDRGFITYSNNAKIALLGVSLKSLEKYGAVSEQVAAEMASGAIKKSEANIAISVTGIAGPGGSANKKEGTVCFGIALKAGKTYTETVQFGAIGRSNVRKKTVHHALNLILNTLK